MLKEESPHLLDHLNSYQQQLSDIFEASDRVISKSVREMATSAGYLTRKWQLGSPAVKRSSLRLICDEEVGEVNERQVKEMVELLENDGRPQGQIDVRGKAIFYKNYELFGFRSTTSKKIEPVKFRQKLVVGQWIRLSSTEKIGLFSAEIALEKNDNILEIGDSFLPLEVRHRMSGDKLLTRAGKQKVKKILIDGKVPVDQRNQIWVVGNKKNDIFWVIGHKKSDLSRQDVNDKIHYIVIYRKISGEKRQLHE